MRGQIHKDEYEDNSSQMVDFPLPLELRMRMREEVKEGFLVCHQILCVPCRGALMTVIVFNGTRDSE